MSNFICPECGMTNIDCGYAGYKTPKEIELEKKLERLQEQLNEANEVIKYFADSKTGVEQEDGRFIVGLAGFDGTKAQAIYYDPRPAQNYCKKWGVK